jgi:hypothetical protein
MNGAYCSDLSNFILDHPQIKYWIHGHLNDAEDYMIVPADRADEVAENTKLRWTVCLSRDPSTPVTKDTYNKITSTIDIEMIKKSTIYVNFSDKIINLQKKDLHVQGWVSGLEISC